MYASRHADNLDGQEFDSSEVLFPTAGGHSSDLSAEAPRALQEVTGAIVLLLHVAVPHLFTIDWIGTEQ